MANDLPLIPGQAPNPAPDEAFQGLHQFVGLQNAARAAVRPTPLPSPSNPVTGSTPQSTLSAAMSRARWNFVPGNGLGTSWQSSPTGASYFHDPSAAAGFLRPPSGTPGVPTPTTPGMPDMSLTVPNLQPRSVLARNPLGAAGATAAAPVVTPTINSAASDGSATTQPQPQPQPQLQAPATRAGVTVGGRALPFGAMVNGVPTFSDGSRGIPRTMSDTQIQSLGSTLNTASAPLAPLASDVLGYTPSTNQMVDQRVAQLQRQQPITGSRPTAQDFADAERQDIASGDWRSAAGTVAHNLMVDGSTGSGTQRRAALTRLGALMGGVNQDESLAGQQATQANQFANATNLENLRGQYGLADAGLRAQQATTLAQLRRRPQLITSADGTVNAYDPVTGKASPVSSTTGTPLRAAVTHADPQVQRTNALVDQLNKGTQEFAKNFLPSQQQPTPSAQQFQQWRLQSARAMGLPIVSNKNGQFMANVNGQWINI